jgi:Family of unknown function (DUF5662)
MGLFWRGLVHDLSKFTLTEWFPYVRYFYGDGGTRETSVNDGNSPMDFEMAWNRHQKVNDHHWQWWVRFGDDGTILALPMPDKARAEMLCDWRGAGKALGKPDTASWYTANKHKMNLHPKTRAWIEWKLGVEATDPDLVYELNHREFIRMSANVVGGYDRYDYP